MDVTINYQSSIKIKSDKTIYFDPFKIKENTNDADYIFITHSHYDHLEKESINKIINENTIIIIPESIKEELKEYQNIIEVSPNQEYEIEGLKFSTIPSYNTNKQFHPRSNNWVGYIVNIENEKVLVSGDTDITDELLNIKCDIAFVPIGGTYTMTPEEGAELINKIKPKKVIPTHYGCIVGNKKDGNIFKDLLDDGIECELLLK
mgnify:CR=1 FL=1